MLVEYMVRFVYENGKKLYECYKEGADGCELLASPQHAMRFDSIAEAVDFCVAGKHNIPDNGPGFEEKDIVEVRIIRILAEQSDVQD